MDSTHEPNFPATCRAGKGADVTRRVVSEPDDPLRTPFEVDRHRIIECTAFRRLEQKTQVFAPTHHDHFRTRLTHTLETAQIGRCLAAGLGADGVLVEVICLAHDLGHPPFGHAGEVALNERMADQGGFNHNAHTLRVVEYLEHPFPQFRGLNLTGGVLVGLRDHQTRYDFPSTNSGAPISSVESQIASIADRIAYNIHDLEDAIGAGFIDLNELGAVRPWADAYRQVPDAYRDRPIHALRRIILDAMLDATMTDVIRSSRAATKDGGAADRAQSAERSLVSVSPAMEDALAALEAFLRERVYQHAAVVSMDTEGRRKVRELFSVYRGDPQALPPRFAARIDGQGQDRVIGDYLAGMTDRFCLAEHRRLTGA